MPAPWDYAPADLVPFTAEVFTRLHARHNEGWLPVQLLTLAAGALAIRAAHRGRSRLLGGILAACWLWVAWAFFWQAWQPLSFAGRWLAGAFALEAALLVALGLAGRLDGRAVSSLRGRLGWAVVLGGLLLPVVLPLLLGRPLAAAEVFGHAPTPTALVTLGLLLRTARPPTLLLVVVPLPVAWLLVKLVTEAVMLGH